MPRCRTTDCPKDARYGVEYKKPLCCYACREDNMKEVVSARCAFNDGCTNKATHNVRGDRNALTVRDILLWDTSTST